MLQAMLVIGVYNPPFMYILCCFFSIKYCQCSQIFTDWMCPWSFSCFCADCFPQPMSSLLRLQTCPSHLKHGIFTIDILDSLSSRNALLLHK